MNDTTAHALLAATLMSPSGWAEVRRREEFFCKAIAVGISPVEAEQLLTERTDADAEFLLKAHIMGVERGAAERILAEVPRAWADWTLEQLASRPLNFPNPGVDWLLGPGATARLWAERAERERLEAIDCGRRQEGRPGDWYASITWSRRAWTALHGDRPPRTSGLRYPPATWPSPNPRRNVR